MALTRANIEVILTKRLAKNLAFVEFDSVTDDGTNEDLNDPIGFAIRQCGGTTTDYVLVDDADVATVDSADYDKLFDIAEWRTIESILGNFDKYGLKVGPRSGYQSQVREGLEGRLKRIKDYLEAAYGFLTTEPSVGYISRDFAEHNEDLPSS
jgi:hypothetical protein